MASVLIFCLFPLVLSHPLLNSYYVFCRLKRAEVIKEGLGQCLYSQWALEDLRVALAI